MRQVLPSKGSNAMTMYMHPSSQFATGIKEESLSSNKEIVKLGGVPGVDYQLGDHRSASRWPGNYVNYQCGRQVRRRLPRVSSCTARAPRIGRCLRARTCELRLRHALTLATRTLLHAQHLVAMVGGRLNSLPAYETTTQASFSDPAGKQLPKSTMRCDMSKPPFQIRDPGRDGKSKMLCTVKSNECALARALRHWRPSPPSFATDAFCAGHIRGRFACDDSSEEYLTSHVLGKPVKDKQKVYTVGTYRAAWTKSKPEIVASGMTDTSEHRHAFVVPNLAQIDATRKMPGHVGSWH